MDVDFELFRTIVTIGIVGFYSFLYLRFVRTAIEARTQLKTPTEWNTEWVENQIIAARNRPRASAALERSTQHAVDQVVRAERIAVFIPTVWGLLLGLGLSALADFKPERFALDTLFSGFFVLALAVTSTWVAFDVLFEEQHDVLQPWDYDTLMAGGSLELAIFRARMLDWIRAQHTVVRKLMRLQMAYYAALLGLITLLFTAFTFVPIEP